MLAPPDPTDLDAVAAEVTRLLAADDGGDLSPQPLASQDAPARVAAVDGGSGVVLDGASFLVGAFRGGAVLRARDGTLDRRVPEPQVVLLEGGGAGRVVDEALAAVGEPPAGARRSLEGALDDLRGLAEIAAARATLPHLSTDDVLLLDGALQPHDPVPSVSLLQALVADASERGVAVVGVAKGTSLRVGRVPALHAARRAARADHVEAPWACPIDAADRGTIGVSLACRLNPAGRDVFRLDVAAPPGIEPQAVVASLVSLGNHPGYPGYPVPLALAHNAGHLDEGILQDLAYGLRRRAAEGGVDEDAWELAFRDFHDLLDLGA